MKTAPKLMANESAKGGRVDAYVGRKALRKCGGVYVVSRHDGLVKVGITEGDFSRRFKELNQTSRSAGIVGIQPEILVPMDEGMAEVESAVHQKLSANREGGEWFRVSAEDAVNAVLSAVARQRVRNAKHRQCIQMGTVEKQREDAGHLSYEEVIEAALFAAQNIEDLHSRAKALAAVAVTQEKVGDKKAARKTFNTALSVAGSIDGIHHAVGFGELALSNIASAQAKAGDINGAFATAQSIDGAKYRAWALRDIASAQAEAGDIDGAFATAHNVDDAESRAWALRDIALAQVEAGDINGAFATAHSVDDAESRAWALRAIASAQVEAGDINGAFATAYSVDDAESRARVLHDITSAQAEARDIDGAFATARSIDNAKFRTWALRAIASAQVKAGDRQSAEDTFVTALSTARCIDSAKDRTMSIIGIASAQAKAGDIGGAFATARSIDDSGVHPLALRDIARAQAEAGDIDEAFATVHNIDKASYYRVWVLHEIADVQAKAGNFRDAMKTAMEIEKNIDRVQVLADIAKHLAAREKN